MGPGRPYATVWACAHIPTAAACPASSGMYVSSQIKLFYHIVLNYHTLTFMFVAESSPYAEPSRRSSSIDLCLRAPLSGFIVSSVCV
jgi:hypothetical protein